MARTSASALRLVEGLRWINPIVSHYSQEELDRVIFNPVAFTPVKLAISRSGPNVLISWPDPSEGFVLESTSTLSPPGWSASGDSVSVTGGQKSVTVSAAAGAKYYRLKKP